MVYLQGIVKVVRVQYVFDVRNEKKFAAQSTEELGCGRSFSHAQGKLCRLWQLCVHDPFPG